MTKKTLTVAIALISIVFIGILLWITLYGHVFQYERVKGEGYDFKVERISEKNLKDVLEKEFPIPTDEVDLAFMQAVTELKFPVGSKIESCYLEDPREFYSRFSPEAHWDFDSFSNSMYCVRVSIPLECADEFAEYMYQMNRGSLAERCFDTNTWFGGEEYFVPGTYIDYDFESNLSDSTDIGAYAIKTEQEYLIYFLIEF